VSDQYRANHETNVNDLIQMLPTTQRGIDVNVQFKSITAFEFTSECMLFDFCNTRLVHGWLADPQDVELYSFIRNLSYNQLVEKQIRHQTLVQELTKKMEALGIDKDGAVSVDATKSEEASIATKEGLLAERFIAESASQLTYHGLSELHSGLREEELCVFFRNNHFSTLYKHNGELLLLVTDQGYANEPLVWEKLCQIDGDSFFLRSDFARYEATSPSISAVIGSQVTDDGFIIEDEEAPVSHSDSDLALALQMQQEEDDRAQQAGAATAATNDDAPKSEKHSSEHKKKRGSKEKSKDGGCLIQ